MSLIGYNGLTQQPERREYDPKEGWITFVPYHGPIAAVQGVIPALVQQGLRFSEFPVQDGVRGIEIRYSNAQDGAAPATDPNDEQTVTWELLGNDLNKDIFDSDTFSGSTLDDSDRENLRGLRDGTVRSTHNVIVNMTGDPAKFRDLIKKGVESFTVSQYVLRRTGVVSLDWQGTFGISNVGKYYSTTTDLNDEENVPATLKFSLPSGQWLKRTPSVRQNRDGRWVSTQEWWHADTWSDVLYEAVTV